MRVIAVLSLKQVFRPLNGFSVAASELVQQLEQIIRFPVVGHADVVRGDRQAAVLRSRWTALAGYSR